MGEARATECNVADSMAAFRTKDPVKLRFIEAALSTISVPPSSTVLRYGQGLGGGAGVEASAGGRKENAPRGAALKALADDTDFDGARSGRGESGGARGAPLKALTGDTDFDGARSGRGERGGARGALLKALTGDTDFDRAKSGCGESGGARGGSAPARPLVRDPGQGVGTKEGPGGVELLARNADIGDEAGGPEIHVRGHDLRVSREGVYRDDEKRPEIHVGGHDDRVSREGVYREDEKRLGDLEDGLHHARPTGNTTASDLEVDPSSPLIFHDLVLVRAARKKLGRDELDLCEQITSVLEKHPGTIQYFRLDGSVVSGGSKQIEQWLEILTSKSIEGVTMVNCNWPEETVAFPLQLLGCQSIERLQLCFYSIIMSDMNMFKASNLSLIDIAHCTITEKNLFELVKQCHNLKELDVGLHSGNMLIHSESLEVIQVWWSEVSTLTILFAPKLRKIVVGVPGMDASITTAITISGSPMLRHVWFNLSTQNFLINGCCIQRELSLIPNLRVLELTIACRKAKERKSFLNFLKSCTYLKELILWRVDDASLSEETDVARDDLFGELERTYCINKQLEILSLKDYRGGQVEETIASTVLHYASKLRVLNLITSSGNPKSSAILSKAKQVLRRVHRPFPPAELNLYEDGVISEEQDSLAFRV